MTAKQKILVLDNTTTLTSPWKKFLQESYDMVEAVGGFEAATKLRNNPDINCIIINTTLSHFNPIEAIDKIRDKFKKVPVIALFDPKDNNTYRNLQQYNINALIKMPMDVTQLMSTVEGFAPAQVTQMQPKPEYIEQEPRSFEEKANNNGTDGELNLESLYYEGQSSLALGNLDGAIKAFEGMIGVTSIKKESWRRYVEEALYQLGVCYSKKKDFQEALLIIDKCLALNQNYSEAKELKQQILRELKN